MHKAALAVLKYLWIINNKAIIIIKYINSARQSVDKVKIVGAFKQSVALRPQIRGVSRVLIGSLQCECRLRNSNNVSLFVQRWKLMQPKKGIGLMPRIYMQTSDSKRTLEKVSNVSYAVGAVCVMDSAVRKPATN